MWRGSIQQDWTLFRTSRDGEMSVIPGQGSAVFLSTILEIADTGPTAVIDGSTDCSWARRYPP